jgi:hypothetical protein
VDPLANHAVDIVYLFGLKLWQEQTTICVKTKRYICTCIIHCVTNVSGIALTLLGVLPDSNDGTWTWSIKAHTMPRHASNQRYAFLQGHTCYEKYWADQSWAAEIRTMLPSLLDTVRDLLVITSTAVDSQLRVSGH